MKCESTLGKYMIGGDKLTIEQRLHREWANLSQYYPNVRILPNFTGLRRAQIWGKLGVCCEHFRISCLGMIYQHR